ncbi:SDR family oxidoreductase (plasmid) [Rhodococcus sp. JS3073]|nr:SDR family oxidoreductase [Rhodococcus opacus]WAM20065.1 SDR family oxidoreductase [Rhodococcus sp. JS3073]
MWAIELAALGIRVNMSVPGPPILLASPGWQAASSYSSREVSALLAQEASHVPLGRPGRPSELADAVLFLACE